MDVENILNYPTRHNQKILDEIREYLTSCYGPSKFDMVERPTREYLMAHLRMCLPGHSDSRFDGLNLSSCYPPGCVCITIHQGDIIHKNGVGDWVLIPDTYIRFFVTGAGQLMSFSPGWFGMCRMTDYPGIEGFMHAHGGHPRHFTSYCVGTGPIKAIAADFHSGPWKLSRLQAFLAGAKAYMEYENEADRRYIYALPVNQMHTPSKETIAQMVKNLYPVVIQNLNPDHVNISQSSSKAIIVKVSRTFWDEIILSVPEDLKSAVLTDAKGRAGVKDKKADKGSSNFMFKGEIVPFKILNYVPQTSDVLFQIHPVVRREVEKKIAYRIKKFAISHLSINKKTKDYVENDRTV